MWKEIKIYNYKNNFDKFLTDHFKLLQDGEVNQQTILNYIKTSKRQKKLVNNF